MEPITAKTSVNIQGNKLGLAFDVNSNPTKKGIKLHFVLPEETPDPQVRQDLSTKISTALQKKFGDAGVVIDYDERSPYKNTISYIVPLNSIADVLIKMLKS